jgi:hypothetical protein
MTWVIGRAGPFGHAIGLSDIRVTLSDGSEHDCLRKIYKVGNQLALGFAGSVAIGLEAVAQMAVALRRPTDEDRWDPLYVAETLPGGMRELFEAFPDEEKALDCHLMLLSAHPMRNDGPAPWAKCFVHRFYSPEFDPIPTSGADIVSIGSGAGIEPYTDALRQLGHDMDMFKLEVGFPGGSGIGLMSSVSSLLQRNPASGISRYLHISLVGRDSVRIGDNGSLISGGADTPGGMPEVATSLEQLRRLIRDVTSSPIEGVRC